MRSATSFVIRTMTLWLALLISAALAALVLGMVGDSDVSNDGPLSAHQALLLVFGLYALVLAAIAQNARVGGWQLVILIGATLYFASSFLLLMESLYFIQNVGASVAELLVATLHVFCVSLAAGMCTAFLWRGRAVDGDSSLIRLSPLNTGVLAILYVIVYNIAGNLLAWQVEDVRQYYNLGADISLIELTLFQLVRGGLWAILAWAILWGTKGEVHMRALLVGLTLSLLAAVQLLLPNPFMPWSVRYAHLIEILISNFAFGWIGALILLSSVHRKK